MTDNGTFYIPEDAPPPGKDGLKNKTIRISLDSILPPKSTPEEKKATSLVPGIPAHAAPIPQTIRLKRPPTSPITVQPMDMPSSAKKAGDTSLVHAPAASHTATAETIKRQTSRIDSADATAPKSSAGMLTTGPILGIPMHAGPIPQTIRLKRPPTSQMKHPTTASVTARPPEPVIMPRAEPATKSIPNITEAPTVIKNIAASKTQTSRIVLGKPPASVSATAKQATTKIPPITSAETPAPKTIRLKRPSTLSTTAEAIQAKAPEQLSQPNKKGETAKIDLPLGDASLTPVTQRKTIKIKRTAGAAAPVPAIPEPAAPAEPAARMQASAPEEEQALVFPIVAFAATICIAALVYIMVAQALGVHLLLPSSMQLH